MAYFHPVKYVQNLKKYLFFIILSCFFMVGALWLYHSFYKTTSIPNHENHSVAGYAHIRDGDSLVIKGVEVRLLGIDAPELAQNCQLGAKPYPCGCEAKEHLKQLTENKVIECHWNREDIFHRALAICYIDKKSINEQMVRDGWAVNFYLFPEQEKEAKQEKKGVWAYSFEIPKHWRREYHKNFSRKPFHPPSAIQ